MVKKIDVSTPSFPNTYALVDDDDYEQLSHTEWRVVVTSAGKLYAVPKGRRGGVAMHRKLLAVDKTSQVIHLNGNGLDNRRDNLKAAKPGAGAVNIPMPPETEEEILNRYGYQGDVRVIDISTKQYPDTYTFVDACDYERLMTGGRWHVNISGRIKYLTAARMRRDANGKRHIEKIARAIMGNPEGRLVDHINGNPLDNRRCNLRVCSHSDNQKNQALQNTTEIQYKGVKHRPAINQGKPYQASIGVDNRSIHLGYFKTAEEAADAYDNAAMKYHGEFARTNAMIRAEREKKKAA